MSDKYVIKRLEWEVHGKREGDYPVHADGVIGEYWICRPDETWHVEINFYAGDMEHFSTASSLNEAKAIAEKDNAERLLPYLEAVA